MVLETHMKLCVTAEISENFFCSQKWKNGLKMGQKQGVLNLLKNLVINYH